MIINRAITPMESHNHAITHGISHELVCLHFMLCVNKTLKDKILNISIYV